VSGLTEAQHETLLRTLREAPDPGGWRAGMDADDYGYLADALAPVVAAMLAEQRKQIAAEIEALPCPGSPPAPLARYAFETGKDSAARIARVGAA
jgi:hypothetical protein